MGWLVTALHIAFWSQIGVLARIYIQISLVNKCYGGWGTCILSRGYTFNSHGLLYPDLGSNILGSFIMGFLVADGSSKPVMILPQHTAWQTFTDLHVGLRTGFCGSLTTFASWQLSLMQVLIGGSNYSGGQWEQWLIGELITGLFCSFGFYAFGIITAGSVKALLPEAENLPSDEAQKPPKSQKGSRLVNIGTGILLVLFTTLWIVLAIVDNHPEHSERRQQWFAILFAPFGAIIRWQLSSLNGKLSLISWLPIGTLIANMLACCIDYALQGALNRVHNPSYWLMLLFGAVRVGFSGALSTVSTYVQEIYQLGIGSPVPTKSGVYAVGSMVLATVLGIIVYGWSVWV